jgi:hypothetical protein
VTLQTYRSESKSTRRALRSFTRSWRGDRIDDCQTDALFLFGPPLLPGSAICANSRYCEAIRRNIVLSSSPSALAARLWFAAAQRK